MHNDAVRSPKLSDTTVPPAVGKLDRGGVISSFEVAQNLHVTIVRVHTDEAISTHSLELVRWCPWWHSVDPRLIYLFLTKRGSLKFR